MLVFFNWSKLISQTFYKFNKQQSLILEGGFQLKDTASGTIAEFNLWNYAVPEQLIDFNTCGPSGNVVSWNTLWEEGNSLRLYEDLPGKCEKGR